MATEIQLHEHGQSYLGPVQTFEDQYEGPEKQSRFDLWGTFRRRWPMILLIWLIPAVPALIVIYSAIETNYTAMGQIMVEPVTPPIIPGQNTQPQYQNFDAFLQTQAELLLSTGVLNRVVGTLTERSLDLAILQAEDPVLEVRKRAQARTVPRSYLINLSVTQDRPQEAVQLTKAILDSYMILEGDQGESQRKYREEILLKVKDELEQELRDSNSRIAALSRTYGASSETQFDVIREAREGEAAELRTAYRLARHKVDGLQYQLGTVDRPGSGTLPEDLFEQRESFVKNDPTVNSINVRIAEVSGILRNLLSRLSEEHEAVVSKREELSRLQNELQEEEKRAGEDFDSRVDEQYARRIEEQRAVLESNLEAAKVERDQLAGQVKELETLILDMGQIGVSIQEAKAQHQLIQAKYDEVVEALDDVDLEKRLPSRISVASEPEIRPDGVNDPRMKLMVMTFGAAFCFAFALALLREHRDHSLHETEELMRIEGLAFLGAVPALRDLEQGMVSQEDFAESYRTIRTAISGKTRGHRDKSFLVTSARSGEGKTSLAVSLAISFTEPGHRVLLIDGDTQAPNASRVLKLKPGFGLSDALVGDRTARECVVPSGIPQLDVLVCQANGKGMAGLLDSRTAESVLNALGDSYDYIILDSPPALSASDALVWATVVDGVVLASFIGETDRTAMGLTCERLEAVGARILGSVAANVPWNSRFYSYSSTSYERQQRGGDRDAGARQHPLLNARLGDEVHSS